jgi:hypothetical protein
MGIQTLTTLFMWCTILNGALLIFSSLLCTFAGGWIYSLHRKFYPISRDAFNIAIYSFIGLYKIVFLTFNLIPYLALLIMG